VRLTVVGAVFGAVLALAVTPVQAAKPAADVGMTTTAVTSTVDGSAWLLLQADKIKQPGNAVWVLDFQGCDRRHVGQYGTQTGATWGPTTAPFAFASGNALQLDGTYTGVVGVAFVGPWTTSNGVDLRTCTHGVLLSGQAGKPWTVLDDFVPLAVP